MYTKTLHTKSIKKRVGKKEHNLKKNRNYETTDRECCGTHGKWKQISNISRDLKTSIRLHDIRL